MAFGHKAKFRRGGASLSSGTHSVNRQSALVCTGFLFCSFSLMMHAIVPSNPRQPVCHQVAFLEAVALERGSSSFPRVVLQALKECQPFDPLCVTPCMNLSLGRQSCLGEMLGSAAHFRAGSRMQGCHRFLPLGLRPHRRRPHLGKARSGPHWSCSLVLEERIPLVCSLY